MYNSSLTYKQLQPDERLSPYIEHFWMLLNNSGEDKEAIILPDGRIDLSFWDNFALHGLESAPSHTTIPAGIKMFCVSFKPQAIPAFFKSHAPILPDTVQIFNEAGLGIDREKIIDFQSFCTVISDALLALLPIEADSRRQKLFDLIYAANGNITVKELADRSGWGSRQINRYFQDTVGMPLKTYCNILRFRAAMGDIKQGKLFPEQEFADQSHFIREVKKYAGVVPKELARNQNDRFIQFSLLPEK